MPDKGLPEGWRTVRLGEVVDVLIGGTPARDHPEYWARDGDGYPWLSIADLKSPIVAITREKITDIGVRKSNTKLLAAGTLVVSFKLSVGRVAMLGTPMYTNEAIAGLKIRDGAVDNSFLRHLLGQYDFRRATDAAIKGATLNKAKLQRLHICLPPPDEQSRIAEVLDSIEAAIEKTEAVIAATGRLRSALLGELLTRGVPGRHTEWKDVPGIGTIPACWEVVRLGDVATVKNGTTPSKARPEYWAGQGMPFIRTGEVNDIVIRSGEQFLTPEGVRAGAVIIPRGSVLVAMIGQGKTRGMAAQLDIDAAVNQNFAAVVPSQRLAGEFFFAWAQEHYDEIRGLGQGSNQGALNCGLVSSIRLPLPQKVEQEAIVGLSRTLRDRLTVESGVLDEMHAAKSATADALLSGRVRVPTVPEAVT